MNQVDQQVEQIARAFFRARIEGGIWESAPRVLQHEFRLYARQAISMLDNPQEQSRIAEGEGAGARSLETA
jgi:hypothetical protein